MTADRSPAYLRTARSPRMLVLLVLLLGAAAVCGRLGVWQLDRAAERGAARAQAVAEEAAGTPPVPITQVLDPQVSFTGDLTGRAVAAAGTFGADELLVPGRALDGRTGLLVLTPFTVEGTSATLAVVRGWVTDAEAAEGSPAPPGRVELTGYLQAGEAGGSGSDLPDGQVEAISPAELVNRWGGPMYSGYLVLSGAEPAQDPSLALLGAPSVTGGGPALQNLAYALQWWIFGAFAVALWVRLVRDEARAAVEDDGAGAGAGAEPVAEPVVARPAVAPRAVPPEVVPPEPVAPQVATHLGPPLGDPSVTSR
ncbi:MAG TPA: SURF1 family protein [Actinotalea sp.]|nr:SURF1 family protein [Actinotalea sp.]